MTYRGYKILLTLALGLALITNGSLTIAAGSPVLVDLLNKGELGDFYAGADRLDILKSNENIVRAEAAGKTLARPGNACDT